MPDENLIHIRIGSRCGGTSAASHLFPAGLAMGTAFVFWGLITFVGRFGCRLVLFGASLAGWITEIRNERKHH